MDNIEDPFEEEENEEEEAKKLAAFNKSVDKYIEVIKQMVIDLLTKTDFSIEKIAKLARVSLEWALEIKQELENSQNKP